MMGELTKLGNELSKDAGLTPRIFKYLFRRINEVRCLYVYFSELLLINRLKCNECEGRRAPERRKA